MNLRTEKRFLRCLKGQTDAELAEVLTATKATAAHFGQPHRHAGLGLRALHAGYYECRCGLDLRLVFKREGPDLVFVFAGNHDQVRAFLKNRPQ